MFKRSFAATKERANRVTKQPKRSFREDTSTRQKVFGHMDSPASQASGSPKLTSAIITLVVGKDQRLFAAHEDVLSHSPFFAAAMRDQFFASGARRIFLPEEEPEILSCVLEYLYKGDYYPRLLQSDKKRGVFHLEGTLSKLSPDPTNTTKKNGGSSSKSSSSRHGQQTAVDYTPMIGSSEATIYHSGIDDVVLRDTCVYCAAERYGLDELKRLALKKQGLQGGIEAGVILRSARYAYAHTPDSDSRLRAHYLALIIRSRRTFKRSGTMQAEMEAGGKMFFDLFVAMCNHMDDLADIQGPTDAASGKPSPAAASLSSRTPPKGFF
ncbi:uncharacterized protein J3D65DRAFT_351097 [Phyllosticta citribraziliensis]|uniref:BTB domain-containing protein n=1 Tax=Phyllosticta citribraziliensis TaxID=989973 RepID=A0ABR1LUC4_9PEZI